MPELLEFTLWTFPFNQPTLPAAPDTASFFLPGLVHQFGNLLLTVQGHVLHVDLQAPERMQDAVLGAVQRGSAALRVVRALLGEDAGSTESASELVVQIADMARVPARECGVTLELRDHELDPVVWVHAEAFVVCCADAIRLWIQCVPSGSTGVVTISMDARTTGGVIVRLCYGPADGRLPFPMAATEVVSLLNAQMVDAGDSARAMPDGGGLELSFGPATMAPS